MSGRECHAPVFATQSVGNGNQDAGWCDLCTVKWNILLSVKGPGIGPGSITEFSNLRHCISDRWNFYNHNFSRFIQTFKKQSAYRNEAELLNVVSHIVGKRGKDVFLEWAEPRNENMNEPDDVNATCVVCKHHLNWGRFGITTVQWLLQVTSKSSSSCSIELLTGIIFTIGTSVV